MLKLLEANAAQGARIELREITSFYFGLDSISTALRVLSFY